MGEDSFYISCDIQSGNLPRKSVFLSFGYTRAEPSTNLLISTAWITICLFHAVHKPSLAAHAVKHQEPVCRGGCNPKWDEVLLKHGVCQRFQRSLNHLFLSSGISGKGETDLPKSATEKCQLTAGISLSGKVP